MSLVDENIRLAGMTATLIRTPSNVTSSCWKGTLARKGLEPARAYERFYLFPSDSGVVEGDLVQIGSEFFLAMSLSREEEFGELQCFQGTLYRCNSTVTVRKYNGTTKVFDDFKTGVRCLIVRSSARVQAEDDRADAVDWGRGTTNMFTCYLQEGVGFSKDCLLVDQDQRQFRATDDQNPTVVDGVTILDMVMV